MKNARQGAPQLPDHKRACADRRGSRSCAQVPPQAPDSLVKLSRSSSATLRGRSQHGRQQHCELVRRVQASVTLAATEGLWRDHGERRVGQHLNQQQRVETVSKAVELSESRLGNTDGDESQEQVPRQREKELAAHGSGEEGQRQAAGSQGAQPDEEPRGLARRASNCSGSAPPYPHEPPSTLLAEDPPSSRAGGTPHPRHEHGDPSNPPDLRGEQASATVADNAVETHAGDETTCAPGGARGNGGATSDGRATEGVTVDLLGPSASQQVRTDPPPRAQPTEPVRQWWRTPPSVMKQRPEQARRGQKRAAQQGRQGQAQGDQQNPQQGKTPMARQGEPGGAACGADGTAAGADGPAPDAARGSAGAWRGVLSEAVVEGFGAGGRGGFVAMVTLSGSAGGLEAAANQAATSSGDGSRAPAITIAEAGRLRD
ncbi:unnamed protein product [Closterium sp. Naga37s-1]|nr:unnamed protein product [Closterium sp. Naga37s-1]